jgi:DNA polymerase III delta subunit
MLTVLVGNDSAARTKRLDALVAALSKKGAEVLSYNDVDFNGGSMRELSGSASLFGGTLAVVVYGIGDVAEKRDEFEKIIPALVESPHAFILSEVSLPAAFIKKVNAKGGTSEEFELKNKPKKVETFNAFLLTDAFSDRKRSVAWGLYRQAIDLGLEPRELHGKLFWCVKTMLIAKRSVTAEESGLNPFVYSKAKRGAVNFPPGALEKIATELTVLFHEALVSGIDLETALEAFILRALDKKAA